MKVPEGAADFFHFEHLTFAAVSTWLNELNLTIVRQEQFPLYDSLFVQVKKSR